MTAQNVEYIAVKKFSSSKLASQERDSPKSDILSMRKVFMFECDPLGFENKNDSVRQARTFTSDFARAHIHGTDQGKIRQWGRD